VARAFTLLGSDYGGWPLLEETPHGALIYSFGVGEDASFDIAAIAWRGCEIHAFDPTPKAVAWVKAQRFPEGFHFHPLGVAAQDGATRFFAPAVAGHASYSLSPADPEGESMEAEVMRVVSIKGMLGGRAPDVIKMDIEGFEYEVIDDLLRNGPRPKQLLAEFHHDRYGIGRERTVEAVQALREAGYRLFYVSEIGREYGFVLEGDSPPTASSGP
jgi:FkbM family methyltransferase